MRTAAILPVKRFSAAKSRLGASLADPLRERLARAMVADVLLAIAAAASIERTIVVTREPSLAETAREHGALLVDDAHEDGQSAAVVLGIARAIDDGIERVLCVPGDCPALDPAELDALLAAADARAEQARAERARAADVGARARTSAHTEVTIVPDRHATGTNGLLLTPPDVIGPAFGPNSCERHRALAHAAGASCRLEHPASLLLDIDTGADLDALRERLHATHAAASRTRAALARPEDEMTLSLADSR